MARIYLENKANQPNSNQVDFYTAQGTHVYFKDPVENKSIDVERVVATVESMLPKHFTSEIEMIIVGWFKEFEERDINAFYKDGMLHVSNRQDDHEDMVDDIVHEIAHSVEEVYGYEIYGDSKIKDEFLLKRNRLHDELWSLGYKAPLSVFKETEYNQEFDEFLLDTVGYDKLNIICSGLFINSYAPTSLREYFATGFTDFYMNSDDHHTLKSVSPALYNKLLKINLEENIDSIY